LTDIHGGYTLTNVPAGFEIINSTKGSYEPQSSGVIVYGHETVTLNIAITQQLVINDIAIRFIVTWRTEPTWPPDGVENDLDSQLWMVIPPDIGNPRHIDPSNDLGSCEHYPDACIKRDTRTGSGPETVDIRLLHPTTTYYFGVLNYNASYPGVPPITQSLAKIQVYNQDGLMQSLNVPTRGTGDLWYAFMMDSSGTITPTNCITTMPPEYDPVNHPEDPMIPPQCPP
jgi:hypothetical protein